MCLLVRKCFALSRSSPLSFPPPVPPTLPFTSRLWILLSNTYVARAAIRSRPIGCVRACMRARDAAACSVLTYSRVCMRVGIARRRTGKRGFSSRFSSLTRTKLRAIHATFPFVLRAPNTIFGDGSTVNRKSKQLHCEFSSLGWFPELVLRN